MTMVGLTLLGCGPDRPKCTGSNPDFKITIKLSDRELPEDTVVHVTYGGTGKEDYVLAAPGVPEVVFCTPADGNGRPIDSSPMVEAAGASDTSNEAVPVRELACTLWTGGYAKLRVSGTGLDADTSYPLTPTDACVVTRTIVLDSPDGG